MGQWGILLLAGSWLFSLSTLYAQPVPLISVSATPWRYYQEGREPTNNSQANVSWKAPEFDDATWPEGLGLFGFEDTPLPEPIRTPLSLFAPGRTAPTTTYYFRTHFNWSQGSNAFLWFTNLLDDGAVIYLNGTEIYRYRITGTPTYATFANASATEGRYETTNVFTRRLKAGDNVLAVEVHQAGLSSADVVFGLALAAVVPEPVLITKHPTNKLDTMYGKRFELSVEATGSDLRYRWYFNNVPLSAGTNATLSMIASFQTGTFHVIVSNVLGSVRSSNSVVTTFPDTFGPRIISAYVPVGETNRMMIFFDEDILRVNNQNREWSGTNVMNYVVTDTATSERLAITLATPAIGLMAVRLTFAQNLDPGKSYELCLYNLSDVRTNYIALNSCVPVGFELTTHVFTFGSNWQFYDWLDAPPANWNDPDYIEDPGLWGFASALFYNDQAGDFNPPCTFRSTALSLGPTAYYFRKRFTLPTNMLSVPVTAMLGRVLDDGAVFYLNGAEIFRINMPAGAIDDTSLALMPGTPNACATNQMAVEHLLRETNVLAVEVHQFASPDYDVAFDASFSLRYTVTPVLTNREPAGDAFLRYSNHSPAELRLYWTNGMGFALEYVNAFGEQWREFQPPSTNLVIEKTGTARFFRLNKRH